MIRKGDTPKQQIKKNRDSTAKETQPIMNEHRRLRDKATEGWSSKNKPKIVIKVEKTRTTVPMVWKVGIIAKKARGTRKKNMSVYRLLNYGTKIKRAIMQSPYFNKTRPNAFGLFGKGGKVARVHKSIRRPGDAKRNWEHIIDDLLTPLMETRIGHGYRKGLKR